MRSSSASSSRRLPRPTALFRRQWRLIVASAIVAALVVGVAGRYGGRALVVTRDVGAPSAILVLASHEWERLPVAAAMARRHPAALVLLTEPARPTPYNCHLCPRRVAWLSALGVPADRVTILPQRVTNTYTEALAARQYARARTLASIVVVTSPYHTRRVLGTFAAVFMGSQVEIGVRPAEASPARPGRWWAAGYDRAYVSYEWTALGWYAFRYGVNPRVTVQLSH